MCDYMKSLFWKLPDHIILHIGTNDALDKILGKILYKSRKLEPYLHSEILKYKITISTPVNQHESIINYITFK